MPLFEQRELSIKNLVNNPLIINPFSILNTITQHWQSEKRRWEPLVLDSTKGRTTALGNATPSNTFSSRGIEAKPANSVSTFDPYLCEILVRWFSGDGDIILDPFAGGNVRGTVATALNRGYTGIDLSELQVMENLNHWTKLSEKYHDFDTSKLTLLRGDAEEVLDSIEDETFNMVLTCPPYYNLEVYSKDGADLSNSPSYDYFLYKYRSIIKKACAKLKDNSFAVIVVSEIRNKPAGGYFYGLVPDTINAFRDAGLYYYNEIILENNIGSLPIRAPRQFGITRKIGRQHQNILVFWKGDLKKISEKYREITP